MVKKRRSINKSILKEITRPLVLTTPRLKTDSHKA
jgi:hypothetical protein